MELRPLDSSLIDNELMPQGDIFEEQGVVRSEARHEVGDQSRESKSHGRNPQEASPDERKMD